MGWYLMSSNVTFSAYYGKAGTPAQVTAHKRWGSPTCSLMRGGKIIWTSPDTCSRSSSTPLRAQGTSRSVDTWAMAEVVQFPILKIHWLSSGVIPLRCAFPKLVWLSYMKFTLLKCLVGDFWGTYGMINLIEIETYCFGNHPHLHLPFS